jgi:hypothetical protein
LQSAAIESISVGGAHPLRDECPEMSTIKPTGTSGFFRMQVDSDGRVVGSFEQIQFSAEKAAIEARIVDGFLASMNIHLKEGAGKFFLENPRSNSQNDFDFTICTPRGPAYLELMEIAPLTGPYAEAPSKYRLYDLAKSILLGVLEKSNRYPKDAGQPIFLLLYVTHWAFGLSGRTIACLRYWLRAQPTNFGAVFAYEPIDQSEGLPHWLYPVPPELIGFFDPEQFREYVCLNLNPKKWQVGIGAIAGDHGNPVAS